ncbi:SDR family NAD(P)-dependent oxidoreductase [Microbispora sp. KK1-11]|jgi:3-oxoacyl-[acyl-carrier protein] reductase|uniref:SDR family NAD(P)-dependent oxidoreductase n=1 Tax=Microbispora sp. KK1-11 TaxID=2053005 RepID=UPI00115BB7E6|nr:SDR family oxidoreductase [Microbispora sp. KK1-11]TQS28038.1 SDR family oxidoreductase [Microbispora sp. KK1-11]
MTRDDGLDGKVAVISGGASGIGRALAVAYARAGAHSVVGYYPGDPHDAGETVAAVEAAGGRCTAVELDVRSYEQTERFAQAAVDAFGRLDIAVAAAGVLRRQPLEEMTDGAWDDMLSVDLGGVLRIFRSCAARMEHGGAMVATSSIAGGVYGWEEHSHYAAAKAGVLGLCRSLAVELASRGIRVNAVIPGLIESPQSLDEVNSLGPQGLREAGKIIPAGRVGTVDEAARVIRFLTSDDAAYVTGQSVVVDGGLTVRWPS